MMIDEKFVNAATMTDEELWEQIRDILDPAIGSGAEDAGILRAAELCFDELCRRRPDLVSDDMAEFPDKLRAALANTSGSGEIGHA